MGLFGLAGCSVENTAPAEAAYRILITSGDNQVGGSHAPLPLPLSVRIRDARGESVRGVRVRFRVDRTTSSSAQLLDSISVSDADGIASATLRLGSDSTGRAAAEGSHVMVAAWIAAAPWQEVRFSARRQGESVLTSVTPAVARAGDRLIFRGANLQGAAVRVHFGATPGVAPTVGNAVGSVTVPPCVAPGAIEFSVESDGRRSNAIPITIVESRLALDLAPHQAVTLPAARVAECVSLRGDGATYLVSAQYASTGAAEPIAWQMGSTGAAVQSALAGQDNSPRPARTRAVTTAHHAFEQRLRALEGQVVQEVRAQRAPSLRSFLVETPAVGSVRSFRVAANTDGSAFTSVTGRLRYAGNRVLVYTDTSEDSFSAAKLFAISVLYDEQLLAEAVRAFGAEPDVDGNGRVIVLFTPAVNRLARREECIQRGYVTGYFYPVDQLERNADSNRGEIFYALVPDPNDRHSCTHTEEDVVRLLLPAFLHEMQHLISFNQRVLARGGDVEEPWLNEGLSQMAEELGSRIFEARYPAPLGRSTTAQIFPDSAGPFIAPQMLNAYVYLTFALEHSVTSYSGNGSLEERGAAWLFLRWLADQKGEAILKRLVQSPLRGTVNVEAVSGESFRALFGDFSLALFADSLPGVARSLTAPRLRFKTRNLRQLMAREAVISGFERTFPMTTYLLEGNAVLRADMPPGTMMHAILRSKPGDGPLRLSFQSATAQPFAESLGAQVSILRLP